MATSSEKERLYLRLDIGMESEMLTPLGEHPPPGIHTHRWTIFVRGPNDTQLDSQLVSKVIFQLHEDFPNPKRSKKKAKTNKQKVSKTFFLMFQFLKL